MRFTEDNFGFLSRHKVHVYFQKLYKKPWAFWAIQDRQVWKLNFYFPRVRNSAQQSILFHQLHEIKKENPSSCDRFSQVSSLFFNGTLKMFASSLWDFCVILVLNDSCKYKFHSIFFCFQTKWNPRTTTLDVVTKTIWEKNVTFVNQFKKLVKLVKSMTK